ncbi:hypothetical protein [Tateyamaria sp. Alg231-49]|uniref:hypothetical protein n=1 Tax=Tateyamaria sp. Alg231-49 TaxID=1922219 RepID=UPI00131ED31D|nr:hypothetical protein [Tateyamaria sp. Alg231-49]
MADSREMLMKKLELLESQIADANKKINNTGVAKPGPWKAAIKKKQKLTAEQKKLYDKLLSLKA